MIVSTLWLPTTLASGASTAPTCSSLSILEYKSNVGAGSVHSLYWVKNTSHAACTLHGYPRLVFYGEYSVRGKDLHPRRLVVEHEETTKSPNPLVSVGDTTNAPVPLVRLAPNGYASFWVLGTDESGTKLNGKLTRCILATSLLVRLPGVKREVNAVIPDDNAESWCGEIDVLPLLAGRSGTVPPKPLSYYFGTPTT